MKKWLILFILLIVGGTGYYFTFGSAKMTEALKSRVDTQLQILQKNGFEIEDRKVESKKEHFVIHYADPERIAQYMRSRHIDISNEDADSLKGLKIAVDLSYLEGIYNALSADAYPVAFPPALIRMETEQGRNNLVKIAKEKIFLAHIDINKLFTSYKGYLKDINATFKDVGTVSILSKDFKFSGTFNEDFLTSSSNSIEKLRVSDERKAGILLEKLEGSYQLTGKSLYDFSSGYHIDKLFLRDENGERIILRDIDANTTGKSEQQFASSAFGFHIKSVDIRERLGKHFLEDITGRFSLENISITALEKMQQLDANDTEGFNQAFKSFLAEGIVLKMDEFSAKKTRNKSGKMVDGFAMNALVRIDKVADFKLLEENPFELLNIIDATMHIELSNAIYLTLMERPEFTIAMLIFTPLSRDDKKIFDIEYKHGSLKLNGKPII